MKVANFISGKGCPKCAIDKNKKLYKLLVRLNFTSTRGHIVKKHYRFWISQTFHRTSNLIK